jgi:hypothetical protein
MKRTSVVLPVLAVVAGAFAQDVGQTAIDKALLAAPANLKKDATVIKWKTGPEYTYDTLRQGTSDIVCYDKGGLPGQAPFYAECTMKGNLARAAQNLKFEAIMDRKERQAALDKAEADGSRVKPVFGSVWYHAMNDPANPRYHMTIAVPGATTKTLGLPEDGKQGGVWIMNAGTSTAHLMTPGE